MQVGTLIELLSQFDPNWVMAVMVPPYGGCIPVEVVSAQRARFVPADALLGVSDVVLLRAVGVPELKEEDEDGLRGTPERNPD